MCIPTPSLSGMSPSAPRRQSGRVPYSEWTAGRLPWEPATPNKKETRDHAGRRLAPPHGTVVLPLRVIRSGATVGANAVVTNRTVVPPGSLAIGVPAVIKPGKSSLRLIQLSSAEYVKNGRHYRQQLTRID